MTSATFMTEFRSSMTFEYKAAMDVSPAALVGSATPQNATLLMGRGKSPDAIERTSEAQHSPGSSMEASLTSSPPLPAEQASMNSTGLSQEYSMRDTHVAYPSSDDSLSMANDMSGYHGDQDDMPSPLAQLQCALEKGGMIGKKIDAPAYPGSSEGELMPRERAILPLNAIEDNVCDGETYKCHLCSYTGNSKDHFNSHVDSHFDHKCPFCDYTSRTEGRLKRHVKDFHSETPPDSWAGTRVPRNDGSGGELSVDDSVSSSANSKARTYRCKQCGFVAYKKNDFWEHNKKHIKAEKLLTCPQCAFVTEYKHHLEYHIRNHYGSKPFKCGKCNYSCVNKSMLNSHMKSHSNIYQYRCSNCSYATKYCHSLKLHLRKYEHKPASVLNVDGTPNPYPVIDVYGTRRGPRPKKRKFDSRESRNMAPALPSTQPSIPYSSIAPMVTSNMPMLYPPQFFNGYHGNIFIRPQLDGERYADIQAQNNTHYRMKTAPLKCVFCDFTTDHQDVFHKHMLIHAAKDNQDLIKLYGIASDNILQIQEHQLSSNHFVPNNKPARENGLFKYEMGDGEGKLPERQPDLQSTKPAFLEESVTQIPGIETKAPCGLLPDNPYQDSQSNDYKYFPNSRIEDQENNNNRSVIVSHKTPETAAIGKQEAPEWGEESGSKTESVQNAEPSPLDLSNAKSNESRSPTTPRENEEGSSSSNENALENGRSFAALSPNSQVAQLGHNSAQSQTRSRRKGKAFKLDRYLQVEDQTSPLAAEISFERTIPGQPERTTSEENAHETSTLKRLTSDNTVVSSSVKETDSVSSKNLPKFSLPSHVSPADKLQYRPAPANGYRRAFATSEEDKRASRGSPETTLPRSEDADPAPRSKWQDAYTCAYCDMAFRDCVMYTMHMGYHGYGDPYTCNMCGQESKDKVEFFLHIARAAHS